MRLGDLSLAAGQTGSCDELDGIAERGLHPNPRQDGHSILTHLHIFLLTPAQTQYTHSHTHHTPSHLHTCTQTPPDSQDLADLLLCVGLCGDDEQTVKQVNGNAVGTHVVGSSDPGRSKSGVSATLYRNNPHLRTSLL